MCAISTSVSAPTTSTGSAGCPRGAQDHLKIIDALLADDYDLACQLLYHHTSEMEAYYHDLLLTDVTAYEY